MATKPMNAKENQEMDERIKKRTRLSLLKHRKETGRITGSEQKELDRIQSTVKMPIKEDTATGDIAAFTTNRLAPRAKDAPSKNFRIVGAVDSDISYLTKVADRKKPDAEYTDRDHEENKKDKKAKPKKKKTTP